MLSIQSSDILNDVSERTWVYFMFESHGSLVGRQVEWGRNTQTAVRTIQSLETRSTKIQSDLRDF